MQKLILITGLALLLSACAGQQRIDRSGEAFYRHAGNPVSQVRYSTFRGWQPAGDEAVLIDFGGRGHYLFELSVNCQFEIRSAASLQLVTAMRSVVNTFDHVLIGDQRCNIVRIRPVDYEALQEELRGDGADSPMRPASEASGG